MPGIFWNILLRWLAALQCALIKARGYESSPHFYRHETRHARWRIMPGKLVCLLVLFSTSVSGADSMDITHASLKADNSIAAAGSRVLRVGQNRRFKHPSEAARQARDGDVIEIDAGLYANDYAQWKQNNLTLRGVGGMAHLMSTGLIPNGKAIWIIDGDNIRIENMEFSGAAVRHTNGAGIRHQGGALTLINTFFHDNEFSILTGELSRADIEIRDSRFWYQKRPVRYSHGIYIGRVRSLRLVGNHFTGTDKGHQVKSRALDNYIAYNRIEDVAGGNSSRLIDLPNCGFSLLVGNELHKASTSENYNAISYGPEGCEHGNEREKRLYVVNNTYVNEAPGGDFVHNSAGGEVLVTNNLIYGAGTFLRGPGKDDGNVRLPLHRVAEVRWLATGDAAVIDRAKDLDGLESGSLVPKMMFDPPLGSRPRPVRGALDVGAREYVP